MSTRIGYRAIVLAASLVLGGLLLKQLVTILLALAITVIVSLPLAWAADQAERHRLPRLVGALAGLLSFLGPLAAVIYLIIPSFAHQARQFADNLPNTISGAERYLHVVTGVTKQTLSRELSGVVQRYTHHPQRLLGPLEQLGLNVTAILAGVVVVLITALYIAVSPEPLISGALRLVPSPQRQLARRVMSRVRASWLGWLRAMSIDMLVLGGLLYVGLRVINLPFAAGFAVFSALLTVIPNYGSIISAVPPVLVGLATSPGKGVLALVVYLIVNQIEGNLILPLVMARTVDLHPAVVAIGVLVMAQLFGLVGVIIAIPLVSLTMILVEELWILPHEQAALLSSQ